MMWTMHEDGQVFKMRETAFDYAEVEERGDDGYVVKARRYKSAVKMERFTGSLVEAKARALELLASIPK